MVRIRFAFLLGITLLTAACGYSHNYMNGNGAPNITGLAPANVVNGSGAFTLTVTGTGFGTDALVYWGGTLRTSTYVDSSHVKANILDADIMNAGTVPVYVHSGGMNSNSVDFTVQ